MNERQKFRLKEKTDVFSVKVRSLAARNICQYKILRRRIFWATFF